MYKDLEHVKKKQTGFSRRFYLLVASGALSRTGTTAFSISIIWITLAITDSAFLAGLADGLYTLPLIFSFYFGAIIDRKGRKKGLMTASSLMRAAALMLVLGSFLTHHHLLIILLIYSCVIITGMMSDIQNSIRSAWTKSFLKEEQYQKGSSFYNGLASLAEGIGFAISGILLYFGYMFAVILLALISVSSVIPVVLIKENAVTAQKPEKWSVKKDMMEGIGFIRKNRSFIQLMVIMIFANFVIAMIGVGFTFTVEKILEIPAFYLSLIFVSLVVGIAAGSLPGSLIKGTLGAIVMPLLALIGVFFLFIAYIDNVLILSALVFFIGLSIGIINSVGETVILRKIPASMMARIMGALNTFALSATFLSGTFAGAIIEFLSVRSLFLIIGSATLFVAVMIIFMKDLSRERIEHTDTAT